MKIFTLALGIVLAPLALADAPTSPAFHGSCSFEGQYASGCIEFFDGTWTAETTQQYCQTQSKAGTTPVITESFCARADYNTLCATLAADGSLANAYVNNLPSFICKKYMNGVLVKRPVDGWPVPAFVEPAL